MRSVDEVMAGTSRWAVEQSEGSAFLRRLPRKSVKLVIGSPPYARKGRRYDPGGGIGSKLSVGEWVSMMLDVTDAAVGASSGDVLWVVNNPVEDGCYHPAVECFVADWYRSGRSLERPCVWHKNPPPGTRDWFTNAWEFVLAFPAGERVWNWEAIAEKPKHPRAGAMRQRRADGNRPAVLREYVSPELARPRDVIFAAVGGGMMGHPIASDNEAPYPVELVKPFVATLTNPGDVVCDPFSGSGTTMQAAVELDRRFVGCDLRESQVLLARERMQTVTPAFC